MIKRLVVKGLNNRSDGNHELAFHPDLNIFTGPKRLRENDAAEINLVSHQRKSGTHLSGNSVSVCFY